MYRPDGIRLRKYSQNPKRPHIPYTVYYGEIQKYSYTYIPSC